MALPLRPLTRLWWVVALLAGVGAVCGLLLGLSASFTSTATFRVNAQDDDATRITQQAQTASRLIDSGPVFQTAADSLEIPTSELRAGTVVSWLTDTEIVSVSVTAPTADQAQQWAYAVSDAVLASTTTVGEQQYADVQRSGNDALANGTLTDPLAEQARREAIGDATAQRQNAALASASLLLPVGTPEVGTRAGLTPSGGIGIGFLAGAASGALGVLTVGRARMRVRDADDIRLLSPGLEAFGDEGVVICAGAALRSGLRTVAVLPVNEDSEAAAGTVSTRLAREFDRCGLGASVVLPSSTRRSDAAATETLRVLPMASGSETGRGWGLVRASRASSAGDPLRDGPVAILRASSEATEAVRASTRSDLVYLVGARGVGRVRDFERTRRLLPRHTRLAALVVTP